MVIEEKIDLLEYGDIQAKKDLLEYVDRGKRKECASVRLASSRTKDRAANYNGNEDYGNEIMSKTKLESIT
jgi:hypothetical protein